LAGIIEMKGYSIHLLKAVLREIKRITLAKFERQLSPTGRDHFCKPIEELPIEDLPLLIIFAIM
jgi:hypothetical protein